MTNPIEKYISEFLEPTYDQTQIFNSKIRSIKSLFEHNSSILNLMECRPAGSFEKGTMLKYNPELDLVMVLNKEPKKRINYQKVKNEVAQLIQDNMPDSEILEITNVSVKVGYKTDSGYEYEVEIVPTFWVDSPREVHKVNSRAYQGITSLWQIEYIKQQKNKYQYFAKLVMLLKDWKYEHDIPLTSFQIELMASSALKYRNVADDNPWEDDLVECYKEIESFTDGSPIFPIDWEYFDEDVDLKYFNNDVLIVDPGDPKSNLAKKITEDDLKTIKSKATSALYHINNDHYDKVFNRKGELGDFSWT